MTRSALRRRFVPSLLALSALVVASHVASPRSWAADQRNPLNLPGDDFLAVFILLTAVAVALGLLSARLVRATWRPAHIEGLSPVAIGYLVEKMPRAFDALFLALAPFGVAKHIGDSIEIKQGDPELPGDLEAFRRDLPTGGERKTMIARLKAGRSASDMLADLHRRGLLLSGFRLRLLNIVAMLPGIFIVGLGTAKIVVEWRQNQPVGVLAGVCAVAAVGLLFFWAFQASAHVTWATRKALKRLRKRVVGVEAPGDGQLALAVALVGATVLAGTAYKDYADVMEPPRSSSNDLSDDDD